MTVYRSPLDVPKFSWSEYEPVTSITFADRDDPPGDSYVTSVTHNGNGNYSIGIDRSFARTFPSNATILFFDVFDGWTLDNWYERILQVRVTMTTDYAVKTVSPYIGIMLNGNVTKATYPNTSFQSAHLMQRYSTATGQTVLTNTNSTLTGIAQNQSMSNHGLFTMGPGGNYPGRAGVPSIRESYISAGYNATNGYVSGLLLKQFSAGSGTETIGVTIETRYAIGI